MPHNTISHARLNGAKRRIDQAISHLNGLHDDMPTIGEFIDQDAIEDVIRLLSIASSQTDRLHHDFADNEIKTQIENADERF
jgi:hypothetical protein